LTQKYQWRLCSEDRNSVEVVAPAIQLELQLRVNACD
jgi:hypothetical protein